MTASRTMTARSAWHAVPRHQVRRFAEIALAEAPALAEEIMGEIRREYPHLPVVLDDSGEPMALIGIRRAIEAFVRHLAQGDHTVGRPTVPPGVFQDFGRGEGRGGRSLDALQATYRMGVRMAWRRFAEIGQRLDIPPPAMYELVDAGYEYLDGLVDQSVRGYAEAAARQAGERLRLQRRLMDLMLAEHHRGDPSDALAERAARIGWPVPGRVAAGVLLRPAREAVAPAVGQGVLLDMEHERPRMVVPEPDAAGRRELLDRALAGWSGAIGPPVQVTEAAKSLRWAEAAVRLWSGGGCRPAAPAGGADRRPRAAVSGTAGALRPRARAAVGPDAAGVAGDAGRGAGGGRSAGGASADGAVSVAADPGAVRGVGRRSGPAVRAGAGVAGAPVTGVAGQRRRVGRSTAGCGWAGACRAVPRVPGDR